SLCAIWRVSPHWRRSGRRHSLPPTATAAGGGPRLILAVLSLDIAGQRGRAGHSAISPKSYFAYLKGETRDAGGEAPPRPPPGPLPPRPAPCGHADAQLPGVSPALGHAHGFLLSALVRRKLCWGVAWPYR